MAMSLQGDTSHLFIEFKPDKKENLQKTAEAGRPIFDDVELVSIQHVGDPKTWSWAPAHLKTTFIRDAPGESRYVSPAENFYEHYKAYKEGQSKAMSGTPLEELTFLTAAKRAELKALNIYTAESLAQMEGTPLKQLGMGGREMKNQAQAYIDRAKEGAMEQKLAAQNAELQEQISKMREQLANVMEKLPKGARQKIEDEQEAEEEDDREKLEVTEASEFEKWSDDDLRALIKERTGTGVRGQPAHETLVRMAEEAMSAANEGRRKSED